MRLAIVLSHPTQYYSPWFRWLHQQVAGEFRVFYLWDFGIATRQDRQFGTAFKWDVDLTSGYDWELVPNTSGDPGTHHFFGLTNPALTARLAAWNPDALLLFGYAWWSNLRAIAWARRRGIPLLFRGDSHLLGRGLPPWPTRLALKLVYGQFAAFLTVGSANRAYFEALGVPASKLHFAPHSVDATRFDPNDQAAAKEAAGLRQELGFASSTRVVLFAGKLIPAKQPRELLEAFLALRIPDTALVFVGDGEEKPALMQRVAGSGAAIVRFLPFANQSEMPARYLAADVFALPSRGLYETWGLAVNEAMHLGRPALVSDRVGCQQDLVTDGETGWVFAADSASALRERLSAALTSDLGPIRANVSARIAGYTYRQTTDGLLEALASLRRSSPAVSPRNANIQRTHE